MRLLVAVLLLACCAGAQDPSPEAGKPQPAKRDSLSLARGKAAMWRSVALDGWGQAYNEEWIKALVFCGTEISMVVSALGQHQEYQRWDDKRKAATDPARMEFYATRADFYLRDRNKILWWWLWLKLGATLDAYVSGSLSNFDADWNERVELAPVLLGQTPGVRIALSLGSRPVRP